MISIYLFLSREIILKLSETSGHTFDFSSIKPTPHPNHAW
jgi:hypothetical protein